MRYFKGFTLAEVLVTLGVIGVVAGVTLPSVIKHHQQQATVSKVKKFYTTMNQAVKLSEAENGSCSTWDMPASSSNADVLSFYNKYLSKYIKSVEIRTQSVLYRTPSEKKTINFIKLSDGSAFAIEYSAGVANRHLLVYFYPQANKFNSDKFSRDRFLFELYKSDCVMKPYIHNWNGKRNSLKTNTSYGCNDSSAKGYCSKLIEYDGWQISKDYPW